MSNNRGMGLLANPVDWVALMAVRPAALVAMDPYHLPPYRSGGCYYLWRPWVPGTMREVAPRQWFDRAYNEWNAKGRPHFDGIQFLNEPNLAYESGYPNGSRQALEAAVVWGRALLPLLQAAWPGADLHSPPLSPHANDLQCYDWLRPLIEACDVLNVHCYFDDPQRYRRYWAKYPLLPMVISEFGTAGNGTAAYGQQIVDYWRTLEADTYVRWAAPFVWQRVPEFAAWGLEGTPAAAVLAREAV